MGLLGNTIWDTLFDVIVNDEPTVIDKLDTIFTDVETEGEKQGCERAAKEYEKVLTDLEAEIERVKNLTKAKKNYYDSKSNAMIDYLEYLENEKDRLEHLVDAKAHDVSDRYDIPFGDIKSSLASGSLITKDPRNMDVLDMVYRYKERKLREAEQRGYAKAKKAYEEKLTLLKAELRELKEKSEEGYREFLSMINDLLNDIAKKRTEIAELSILL